MNFTYIYHIDPPLASIYGYIINMNLVFYAYCTLSLGKQIKQTVSLEHGIGLGALEHGIGSPSFSDSGSNL